MVTKRAVKLECDHPTLVPVSRDVHAPDGPTLWRCVECGEQGRYDPAEGMSIPGTENTDGD